MQIFRCQICGETYIGDHRPTQCPFCGAHSENIILATEYPPNINDVTLTVDERSDLEHSVVLELYNARFYFSMGERDRDSMLASTYRALGKVEREHLSVFCKLLKRTMPEEVSEHVAIADDWCTNIIDSSNQEIEARDFYRDSAMRATSARVKQVFHAIATVEDDHIYVDKITHAVANCTQDV